MSTRTLYLWGLVIEGAIAGIYFASGLGDLGRGDQPGALLGFGQAALWFFIAGIGMASHTPDSPSPSPAHSPHAGDPRRPT